MEAAGLAIGITSLASILQTCLAGYRALNASLEVGDSATGLTLRFRIEETRLGLWARSRGFDVDQSQASSVRISDAPKGDILEIPPMRQLVAEILGRMLHVLDEYTLIREKYKGLENDGDVKNILSKGDSLSLSLGQILKIKGSLSRKAQDISRSTSLPDKLRWGLKNKEALEGLLEELRGFNDGLESLLPRREALILSQGLIGEFIHLPIGINQYPHLSALAGQRMAGVITLRQNNRTNVSETTFLSSPSPNVEPVGTVVDPLIPTTSFKDFTVPRMRYTNVREADRSTILEIPPTRSIYLYSPDDGTNSQEFVMVEWRSQHAESADSCISEETMSERRKDLANLLHRTANTDNGFRVLDCLGYTLTTGRLPDGESHPLVGFIYRLPVSRSTSTAPISLREILGESYNSEETHVPTLDDRYCLAHIVSSALYQLHCAGWIHRKLSSYNIVFFPDSVTGALDFAEPFVCGWQYARPDHWATGFKLRPGASEYTPPYGLGDLEMYVHPDRLDREKGLPLFRRSYDIYSLGVILVEIAFWEPIIVLADPQEREKMVTFEGYIDPSRLSWSKAVINVAQKELGSEMGIIYQKAVLSCLAGLQRPRGEASSEDRHGFSKHIPNQEEVPAKHDMAQLDPGIEKEFFWMVVEELGRIVPA